MRKNNKITIKFDIAKEGRRASREAFKDVRMGNYTHKNKKAYTRKQKHRNAFG